MTTLGLDALERAARAATPGEWHHCQPFQTVPKQRTIHGSVPAQRVDYVSTWPGPGTPKGHRIIANMEGRESAMRSEDMAFIARANPVTILSLISGYRALQERVEGAEKARDEWRRTAVDRGYMMSAYYHMLGEKGLQAADRWRERGVKRIHFDWGPDAAGLSGEQRAELVMAFEDAPSREVEPGEIDGFAARTKAGEPHEQE